MPNILFFFFFNVFIWKLNIDKRLHGCRFNKDKLLFLKNNKHGRLLVTPEGYLCMTHAQGKKRPYSYRTIKSPSHRQGKKKLHMLDDI